MNSKLVQGCLASALGIAAYVPLHANAAADFRLERLTPREMYLAPGQSAPYVLRIHNIGDAEGTAHIGSDMHNDHAWLDDFTGYTLLQSYDPNCAGFSKEWTGYDTYNIVFDTGPIAPDSHLDCEMTVVRDVTSDHDMSMDWSVRVSGENQQPPVYDHATEAALVGTLTDVSIIARSFQFSIDGNGLAHAIVEVSIYNGGPWPVRPQSAGYCEEHYLRPFFTDGTGPGGCGEDWNGPQCIDWGYGFLMPLIEANDTYRCLIRLTSKTPYETPLAFPIEISGHQGDGILTLIDVDTANNLALLRLEPTATNTAPVPSNTRIGLFACVLLTIVFGGWWVRRRTPTF